MIMKFRYLIFLQYIQKQIKSTYILAEPESRPFLSHLEHLLIEEKVILSENQSGMDIVP